MHNVHHHHLAFLFVVFQANVHLGGERIDTLDGSGTSAAVPVDG